MLDSMNLNRAFRPGFKRGSRLAVTITTITVIAASRAWPGMFHR
jgi:hypothetical protein